MREEMARLVSEHADLRDQICQELEAAEGAIERARPSTHVVRWLASLTDDARQKVTLRQIEEHAQEALAALSPEPANAEGIASEGGSETEDGWICEACGRWDCPHHTQADWEPSPTGGGVEDFDRRKGARRDSLVDRPDLCTCGSRGVLLYCSCPTEQIAPLEPDPWALAGELAEAAGLLKARSRWDIDGPARARLQDAVDDYHAVTAQHSGEKQ
jgi:hypothetical protein